MIIDKERCKRKGLHNLIIFISAFPFKRFCHFCMEEVKEEEVLE